MHRLIQHLFTWMMIISMNYGYAADLKKIEEEITDSVITTKITAKFTKNTELNPFKISISTDNGRVRLTGFVNNKAAFNEALRLAKSTKGVKTVDTHHLEVKPVNTAFTDTYITTKVEATLLKAKVLDDESIPFVNINVSTKNGVVTLSGTVKHRNSISILNKRILAVRGVKKVNSKLTVEQPHRANAS